MRVIKLTESDLKRIVNKVLREQTEEPEKSENLLLALRNFAKGKLTDDDLYEMDADIEDIRLRNPLGQTVLTIKLGDKKDFLEEIGIDENDAWFRDIIFSSYNGYEFIDSYTIEEDFKEGYIFEYDLTDENLKTLKDIAVTLLPQDEFNLEDDEYIRKLHKTLLDIFPMEIDYILGDYSTEKDIEMNRVAKKTISLEFDDKIESSGIDLSYDYDEAKISIADLFSESIQLNLFNSNAREMVSKIIQNKLGGSVGGWYENSYEFRDDSEFDKESFNREVTRQFEKILEKMDEDSDTEYTIKDYIEFRGRVLSKFKMLVWYETPKDKDIIFSIRDFEPETMSVIMDVKDRGTDTIKNVKMSEQGFNEFLHQPSLFKFDEMY